MENLPDTTIFDVWNQKKKLIHTKSIDSRLYYREGEIWWCSLGVNIGSEQNGTNDMFERPVVVLRKFSEGIICVIPLTTNIKNNTFYVKLMSTQRLSCAIVSQFRTVSPKRLLRKMGTLSHADYSAVLDGMVQLLIKSKPPLLGGGISEPLAYCEVIIPPEDQL